MTLSKIGNFGLRPNSSKLFNNKVQEYDRINHAESPQKEKERPLSEKNINRAARENTATDSINSEITKEIDMILHGKIYDYATWKKEQFTNAEKKTNRIDLLSKGFTRESDFPSLKEGGSRTLIGFDKGTTCCPNQ
jgi:hypothetical protein